MSWAEVKKINSDINVPLDAKMQAVHDSLYSLISSGGGQQGDLSALVKSLAKQLENVIVDRTTGSYYIADHTIPLTNSAPFELYGSGEMFIATKYIDAIEVLCDVAINKNHWLKDANGQYYVTVPFTGQVLVGCNSSGTITFSYIAKVRSDVSVDV